MRDPTYYIFKGAVPIYVIVGFAFFQFAMDVDSNLRERLNNSWRSCSAPSRFSGR